MASELNLIQTAELIKRSMLVISNDTGMLHIADSLDKPIIGIYSGWHFKGKWYPQGANSIVFRKEPKCHTCYKENCEHITCLKMISADEVFEAADSILRRQLTAKTL
jgi:heptosyltransferase-2